MDWESRAVPDEAWDTSATLSEWDGCSDDELNDWRVVVAMISCEKLCGLVNVIKMLFELFGILMTDEKIDLMNEIKYK